VAKSLSQTNTQKQSIVPCNAQVLAERIGVAWLMKVKSIRYVGKADVYNMNVEDTHDFVIQGGIVAHNCDSLRYFCMMRPIAPRVVEEVKLPMHDPLDQYGNNKYNKAIFRRI
jgi:hypothetical protein